MRLNLAKPRLEAGTSLVTTLKQAPLPIANTLYIATYTSHLSKSVMKKLTHLDGLGAGHVA
jgi:hypothetical protein